MTRTTVYADIVGDLFHAGHVSLLRAARAMGDRLIVGVHDDEAVASYKRMPVLSMQERMAVAEGCRYCDVVLPHAPLIISEAFLRENEIDLVVHGDDSGSSAPATSLLTRSSSKASARPRPS